MVQVPETQIYYQIPNNADTPEDTSVGSANAPTTASTSPETAYNETKPHPQPASHPAD